VEVSATMLSPLISDLYSKRVSVSDRATQLSVYAMMAEIISFGLSFLMSVMTAHSYYGSFVFCSLMAVAGIGLFLTCYRKDTSVERSIVP